MAMYLFFTIARQTLPNEALSRNRFMVKKQYRGAVDPQMAAQTRAQILETVSSERILVGGMHFGKEGFSYIKKLQTGYAMVAAD